VNKTKPTYVTVLQNALPRSRVDNPVSFQSKAIPGFIEDLHTNSDFVDTFELLVNIEAIFLQKRRRCYLRVMKAKRSRSTSYRYAF
jgi:hypothetical protein